LPVGGDSAPWSGEPAEKQQFMQLRISNLRKFDKFQRKHRRLKGGTNFTCSSRSAYSVNNDINEMLAEEDSDYEEVDMVSRLDIEEDLMGEIQEQLLGEGANQ